MTQPKSMLDALPEIALRHRADLLSQQRSHLERLSNNLDQLARNAHARGDKTDTNHALEMIETLTDLAQTTALLMRNTLADIQQHTNKKRETK